MYHAARGMRKFAGILAGIAGLLSGAGCTAPPSGPPNVLLIVIDTLRYDHTSLAGYPKPTTPTLDALAQAGAQFTTAYAPMSITAPTHATLFTGEYPIAHGVVKNGLPLDKKHTTLAEAFAAQGYRTGAVVSSFALDARFGLARGFESYADEFEATASTFSTERWEGHAVDGGFDRRAHETTKLAVRWLEQASGDAPFFLFVHYFDPHSPYTPPEPFRSRFWAGAQDDPDPARRTAAYDGEIAFVDDQIARLLESLEHPDQTLVVVTSDHGEGLMQRGHWYHSVHIYEEAVRVPLIFRWPERIPAGTRHDAPVEMVDLFPTLLELADLPQATAGPGRSLAAALRGEATLDPQRPVFLQRRYYNNANAGQVKMNGAQFGIRSGHWKFIVGPRENRTELYDLNADPRETANLIDRQPERARELATRLHGWRDQQFEPPQPTPALAPDVLRGLEALGYIE